MHKLYSSIFILACAFIGSSCSASQDSASAEASLSMQSTQKQATKIITSQNGLSLTQGDLERAIQIETMLNDGNRFSDAEKQEMELAFIEEFKGDPEGFLSSIDEVMDDIDSGYLTDPSDAIFTGEENSGSMSTRGHNSSNRVLTQQMPLAQGHQMLRKTLRERFGPQFSDDKFTSPSLSQLRSYLANSRVVSSGANQYSSSAHNYTFCADGTFIYQYGSSMSFGDYESDGWGAGGTLEASARGYWDTYSEIGNAAILLYSTDPGFADESTNGLLPIPIAAYQQDLIQIGARGTPATPDMLLSRTPTSGC